MERRKIYYAGAYIRMSKEDKGSIENQGRLIEEYVKRREEIVLCTRYVDEGYRGGDFIRPGFLHMMEDIENRKINCVIVKDLSRFGRNYIESGMYIEQVFPNMGVRFISLNDGYDSVYAHRRGEMMYLPLVNLLNDYYSRDLSIKIRSHLSMRRNQGKFTGSFAPYGYKKDPEERSHLIPDSHASMVVKEIFLWKIQGYSQGRIAHFLNQRGELSPYQYKKYKGDSYQSGFAKGEEGGWSPTAVGRILENSIYMGTLIQGKRTTKNYKTKELIKKEKKDWIITKKAHEPIISKEIYEIVKELLKKDKRTAPGREKSYLFSGLAQCASCGESMIRKKVKRGDKEYVYYVCVSKKYGTGCLGCSISEEKLLDYTKKVLGEKELISLPMYAKEILIYSDKTIRIIMREGIGQ